MATPQFQQVSLNTSLLEGSPNSITWNAKDPSGADVNISSGYTATLYMVPTNNAPGFTAINLGTNGTFDYSVAGKLTWTQTAAQASTAAATFPVLSCNYNVALSNDGGTTHSRLGSGVLVLTPKVGP